MDLLIFFFRDILSGPIYIVVSIICVIFICSCIGYLAERYYIKKEQVSQFNVEHFVSSTESKTTHIKDNSSLDNNIIKPNAKNFNASTTGIEVDINKMNVPDNLGLSQQSNDNLLKTQVTVATNSEIPVSSNSENAVALSDLDSVNNNTVSTDAISVPINDNPQVVFQSNTS